MWLPPWSTHVTDTRSPGWCDLTAVPSESEEVTALPPTLVIQRKVDNNHPLDMQERLVDWYRKRGGHIEMPLFDSIPSPFKISDEFPETLQVVEKIADFIQRYA